MIKTVFLDISKLLSYNYNCNSLETADLEYFKVFFENLSNKCCLRERIKKLPKIRLNHFNECNNKKKGVKIWQDILDQVIKKHVM